MISSTIDGDYQNGHGVECYVFNNGETFLDIHAQDGAVGVSPHLSLTYWQFSSYQKERDEDFDPPAPRSSTFELSATIGHGADRYTYNSPSDFRDYLSLNPSCHTTFSSTGAQITGTMTCENLQNAYRGSVADITVKFSCERRSEH